MCLSVKEGWNVLKMLITALYTNNNFFCINWLVRCEVLMRFVCNKGLHSVLTT